MHSYFVRIAALRLHIFLIIGHLLFVVEPDVITDPRPTLPGIKARQRRRAAPDRPLGRALLRRCAGKAVRIRITINRPAFIVTAPTRRSGAALVQPTKSQPHPYRRHPASPDASPPTARSLNPTKPQNRTVQIPT